MTKIHVVRARRPALRGGGCHLRVVPPGQLLRRPRTPSPCDRRMFRNLLNFLRSICNFFSNVWTVFMYVDVLLHFLMFEFRAICVVKFLSHVFFMFPIVWCFVPSSFRCFNGFSVASCVTVQDVEERPLTYN